MTKANNAPSIQNPELIEIDWNVHQLIELERKGYGETPNEALRRLLGLDMNEKPRVRVPATKPSSTHWESDGVYLEEGTDLRFSYRRNAKPIMGKVKAGKIFAAGKFYASLSSAANDLAVTKTGARTKLNGWLYWSIRVPQNSDNWVVLDTLRQQAKNA